MSRNIEFEYRTIDRTPRQKFSLGDLGVIASLMFWGPVSWLTPPSTWRPVARWLAATKHRLSPGSARSLEKALQAALDIGDDTQIRNLAAIVDGGKYELRAQILRLYRTDGWRPAIRLRGSKHLDEALNRGHGAILWANHFIFGGTLIKMALAQHGYDVHHLSRPEHGFSKTAFGIRVLNPIRCRVEDRFLAERIVIDRHDMRKTRQRILGIVEDNGILSITVGAWEGRMLVDIPFLGYRLKIAAGAPNLSYETGAPLLPVTAIRLPGSDSFEVIIGTPLPNSREKEKREAVAAAMEEFGRRLERDVLAAPEQWRGWNKLSPVKPKVQSTKIGRIAPSL